MINDIFVGILDRSFVAGILTLVILFLRFIFRTIPRKYFVLLWGLLGIRLLLPMTVESSLSLIPDNVFFRQRFETAEEDEFTDNHDRRIDINRDTFEVITENGMAGDQRDKTMEPHRQSDIMGMPSDEEITPDISEGSSEESISDDDRSFLGQYGETKLYEYIHLLSWIWLIGVFLILLWILIRYIGLKRRVNASIEIESGIRVTDYVDTAFVLGVFHPVIYIPSTIRLEDVRYIYLHEQAHIKRKDNVWKMAGFLLLAVYWFHPLIWIAYRAFNRDIEYACDEMVLDEVGTKRKKEYAAVLLSNISLKKEVIMIPLGIADVSIKERIQRILNYRETRKYYHVLAIVICLTFSACFMTDPTDHSSVGEEGADILLEETEVTTIDTKEEMERTEESAETVKNTGEAEENVVEQRNDTGYFINDTKNPETIIEAYVRDLCMTMREEDSRTFSTNDFATINGYIVARYLSSIKYFYMSNYEEGIRDLNLNLTLENIPVSEGIHRVSGVAVTTIQYDKTLWRRQNIGFEVTYKLSEKRCECIDIDSTDEAVEEVKKAIAEKGLTQIGEQTAYVDSVFPLQVNKPRFPHAVKHAIMDYMEGMLSTVDSDSTKVYSPEAFETENGYLGARYFVALREYNVRQFGEKSIDDTQVTGARVVSMIQVENEVKERYIVEAEIYYSWLFTQPEYHLDHEKHQSMHSCELLVEANGDGTYRCIEFNNVGVGYDIREEIKEKGLKREEAVQYINRHIDECAITEPLMGRWKEIETEDHYVLTGKNIFA